MPVQEYTPGSAAAAAFHDTVSAIMGLGEREGFATIAGIVGERRSNYFAAVAGTRKASLDLVFRWITAWNDSRLPRLRLIAWPPAPPYVEPVGFAARGIKQVTAKPLAISTHPWWTAAARDVASPRLNVQTWADLLAGTTVRLTAEEADLLLLYSTRHTQYGSPPIHFDPPLVGPRRGADNVYIPGE